MTAPRRYLVAPDKFKGTLTAPEAAASIARGIRRVDPDGVIVQLPFADGGEGTVEAVVRAGGERRVTRVTGPLGARVTAAWARVGDVAVIEMAQASGLRYVSPTSSTSLAAETFGTGELIATALAEGVTRIVLGVGGSASTEGGFGALRALGARFLDADGAEVRTVSEVEAVRGVDIRDLNPLLGQTAIEVCADVRIPLTGPAGSAHVFSPQKGADAAAVVALERRLHALARAYGTLPGGRDAIDAGGAAGGLAAGAAAVLGARLRNGVEVMAEVLGLDARIREADLVVVGEGSLDDQSRLGKAPIGIARRARRLGVPAIAVVGVCAVDPASLAVEGIGIVGSAADAAPDLAAALTEPGEYVAQATESAVRRFLAVRAES